MRGNVSLGRSGEVSITLGKPDKELGRGVISW